MTVLSSIRDALTSSCIEQKNKALACCEILLADYMTRIDELEDEQAEYRRDALFMQAGIQNLKDSLQQFNSMNEKAVDSLLSDDWREDFKLAIQLHPEQFSDILPEPVRKKRASKTMSLAAQEPAND